MATAAFIRVAPSDCTPGTTGSYQDVDAGDHGVPASAVGVWLRCDNPTGNYTWLGARKNGSTDDFGGNVFFTSHTMQYIGLDANGLFEVKVQDSSPEVYVVGYMTDPVTMFTNAEDKSTATTGSFVDVDISSECPDATMALLVLYSNTSNRYLFVRKNGSTDDRSADADVVYSTDHAIVGLDGSQLFEQKIQTTTQDCFIQGFYDGSKVTMHTNATDRRTATTGSWEDVAALAAGAKVGFYAIHNTSAASPYSYGLRKNGAAEEPYADKYYDQWSCWMVECDTDRKIEQKIENAAMDLWELGYAEDEVTTHIKALSATAEVTAARVARRVGKGINAALSASGTARRLTARSFSTAVDVAAGLAYTKVTVKILSATVDASATVSRQTQRTLAAYVDVAPGVLQRAIARTIATTVKLSATARRQTARTFRADVAITASMVRSLVYSKALAASVVITGSMIRMAGKVLAAGVDISAAITQRAIARTFTAGVDISGTVRRGTSRTFSAGVDVAATARRRVGKLLQAAQVTVAGDVIRSAGKVLAAGVTVAGIVTRSTHYLYLKALSAATKVRGTVTRLLMDIAYAMNKAIRQTFAKVQITYSDPHFSAGVVATSATVGRHTYAQQTADNVEGTEYKWFSLHRNNLGGTFHPLPGDKRYSVGWWGTELSNAVTRAFAGSPTIEITFSPRTVDELLVMGDDQLSEFPVDFTVNCYSDDPVSGDPTVLEHTEPVTGNIYVRWTKDLTPTLTDITKMELIITKWSRAGAVCKITQFFTLVEETYYSEDGELVSVRMLEEMEYSGSTIPQGNLAAAEITVKLNNIDNRFSPGNTASPLYGLLKNNRAIKAWLGVDLVPSGVRRWYPLGVFYSRDWDTPTEEVYAEVIGLDTLDRLRTTEFSTSEVYVGQSLEDLAILVMTDAGLTAADWDIDPTLAAYTVAYAWFDRMTHREALRRIAAAAMGQCYCNRDGQVVLEVYEAPTSVSFDYTRANVFAFDAPLRWSEMINYVEARSTPRVPAADQEIVSDPEVPFTVPAGGSVTKTYFYYASPCVDVQAPVITGGANTTVDSYTAYAWGIMVTFANAGVADEEVTSVSVNGKPLEIQAGRVVNATDDDSIAQNGKQMLSAPLESEFWQTEAQAQAAATAVLGAYSNPRRDLVMRARGNIAQVLGDQVNAPQYMREGTNIAEYAIMRQDINWDGGLEIAVTAQRITKQRHEKALTAGVSVEGVFAFKGPVWPKFLSTGVTVAASMVSRLATFVKALVAGVTARGVFSETTDVYADALATLYCEHAVYATAWAAATALSLDNGVALVYQNVGGGVFYIARGAMIFPTGDEIAADRTVTSAELWVYPSIVRLTSGRVYSVVVQNGQPTYPHDPVVVGDYDKAHYAGDGGSIGSADLVAAAWNKITLKATALGWIQKGAGNDTKLMLRLDKDIDGSQPPSGVEGPYIEDAYLRLTWM